MNPCGAREIDLALLIADLSGYTALGLRAIAHGGAIYRFRPTECARAFAQAPGLYAGSGAE